MQKLDFEAKVLLISRCFIVALMFLSGMINIHLFEYHYSWLLGNNMRYPDYNRIAWCNRDPDSCSK